MSSSNDEEKRLFDKIVRPAQNKALNTAMDNDAIKKILSDPNKLVALLKDTVLKMRFEAHIDLYCLPRGKESPNHDYTILYRDQKGKASPINNEELQIIIGNFAEMSHLPINISYKQVRKDGEIFSAVFLDTKQGET